MSRSRTTIATATMLLITMLASSCSHSDPESGASGGGPVPIAALVSFDACADYLSWVRSEALERVGPYGLEGGYGVMPMSRSGGMEDAVASRESTAALASPDAAPPTSAAGTAAAETATGTNNQEAGVDELDQVKTDGRRIVAVRDDRLVVVDISDGAARRVAELELGLSGGQLFLEGDRAIVAAQGPFESLRTSARESDVARSFAPMTTHSTLVEVDLSNGGAREVSRRVVEGSVVAGRLAGGVVRLIATTPQPASLGFVSAMSAQGEEQAEATNRSIIEQSRAEDWLPAIVEADGSRRPLVSCDAMYHPAEFSGFTATTVLSVPDGLDSMTATGLVADAGVTYASPTALYVATTRWAQNEDSSSNEHTDVHRFDIATSGPAVYQASGRVEGSVLNQYALSEDADHLRIATTTTPNSFVDCPPNASCQSPGLDPDDPRSSRVTVLTMQGDRLVETGKVVGLGPTEQIQGVRFMGDRGYVVTFRQTDPLYVLDLADPTAPKVLGELKVTGFSDYLHPVGGDRLLGVGVEASDQGVMEGGKIALYDTSDPTRPVEVAKLTYPFSWFAPGSDPHAFTWDAEQSTATIVGSWHTGGMGGQQVGGAIVVRVDGDRLVEVARLVHDARANHPVSTTTTTTTTTAAPTTTTTVPGTTVVESTTTTLPAPPTTLAAPPTTQPAGTDGPNSTSVGEPIAPDIAIAPDIERAEFTIVPIERTLLAGGRLWAISMLGLSGHDRVGMAEVAWTNWS